MTRKRCFWPLVALVLPLAAQAQDPSRCKVEPWQFANEKTVPVSLSMPNDGKPCTVRKVTFQGGTVATYTVSKPPSNGSVVIKKNEALYTPKAGFIGTDKFVLDVAGINKFAKPPARSGKLEVTVAVAKP
jgi:hypothetical protein